MYLVCCHLVTTMFSSEFNVPEWISLDQLPILFFAECIDCKCVRYCRLLGKLGLRCPGNKTFLTQNRQPSHTESKQIICSISYFSVIFEMSPRGRIIRTYHGTFAKWIKDFSYVKVKSCHCTVSYHYIAIMSLYIICRGGSPIEKVYG